MIYFDSAYIARCYLPEPPRVLRLPCLVVGRIEVASVVHRKLRENAVTAKEHRELHLLFSDDIEAGVRSFLPITTALLQRAQAAILDLPRPIFLRSADCLHLCAAVDAGFKEIYSNDRHLRAAAPHFGLRQST